jgi:hypothetical protein
MEISDPQCVSRDQDSILWSAQVAALTRAKNAKNEDDQRPPTDIQSPCIMCMLRGTDRSSTIVTVVW